MKRKALRKLYNMSLKYELFIPEYIDKLEILKLRLEERLDEYESKIFFVGQQEDKREQIEDKLNKINDEINSIESVLSSVQDIVIELSDYFPDEGFAYGKTSPQDTADDNK